MGNYLVTGPKCSTSLLPKSHNMTQAKPEKFISQPHKLFKIHFIVIQLPPSWSSRCAPSKMSPNFVSTHFLFISLEPRA